jgi:hypothetical protein
MNPTRGNNPVDDASTVANTRCTVLALANISIEAVDRKKKPPNYSHMIDTWSTHWPVLWPAGFGCMFVPTVSAESVGDDHLRSCTINLRGKGSGWRRPFYEEHHGSFLGVVVAYAHAYTDDRRVGHELRKMGDFNCHGMHHFVLG